MPLVKTGPWVLYSNSNEVKYLLFFFDEIKCQFLDLNYNSYNTSYIIGLNIDLILQVDNLA